MLESIVPSASSSPKLVDVVKQKLYKSIKHKYVIERVEKESRIMILLSFMVLL